MNGAEGLIRTAVAAGVEVCFANPGTTEMHLVAALDALPGVRAVLGLFEGVCTGAADGYGRMMDRPALTLLHLGPGFANGIANLHNARRAASPVVALIGDHPTWHVGNDPPLASDIESLARPVSRWVKTVKTPAELPAGGAAAIAEALASPRGVATLIVPADCAWGEVSGPATPAPIPGPSVVSAASVDEAGKALTRGEPAILLLGGPTLRAAPLRVAARIAAATGCRLMCDVFLSRLERGAGIPPVDRLPYFPEQARELLSGIAHLVVVGTAEPVAFFGYPGGEPRLVPQSCELHPLAGSSEDAVAALEALAERVGAPPSASLPPGSGRPEVPSGALDTASVGRALAALQPEGAIVVDEAATTGAPYWFMSGDCPPSTYLGLTGGAIGQGLPCATGAAIACPERPVVSFQADGSGLYTAQALWSQAREGLNVTTVICANREYRILRVELARADIASPGPQANALTSLRDPVIDWVSLSRGLGVPAVCVETADALATELARSFAEPGPRLIEAVF